MNSELNRATRADGKLSQIHITPAFTTKIISHNIDSHSRVTYHLNIVCLIHSILTLTGFKTRVTMDRALDEIVQENQVCVK